MTELAVEKRKEKKRISETILRMHAPKKTEYIWYGMISACALISAGILIAICVYILKKGAGIVTPGFLTTVTSVRNGTIGIAGNLVNTLYLIVMTLLLAVPVGIGGAIYLNEYAENQRFKNTIVFCTETLAGIPSVLYGLFGMVFFGGVCGLGFSLWSGALTMSLMVLPLILRSTQEALKAVPIGYRVGAVGLGSRKWYMIRTILLPSAMPGIVSGILLSIGRVVGESAALLFTAGSAKLLPGGVDQLLSKTFESGGSLTIQLYLSMAKGEYQAAFGIALILLILVFFLNLLSKFAGWILRKKYGTVAG